MKNKKCNSYSVIEMEKYCIWKEDEEGDYWETSCGELFTIIDGTPKNNKMNYCTYCGKKLKQKLLKGEKCINGKG